MLSVGSIAFILNIGLLAVVTLSERVFARIIFDFATSHLINKRTAPILCDGDTAIPSIPATFIKYRRYPAILFTVLISAILLGSELFAELGVTTSKTCRPQQRNGTLISPGGLEIRYSTIFLQASASMERIEFYEGNLTRVQAGLPSHVTSDVCFSCIPAENPDIVKGCSVQFWKTYEPRQLEIGVVRSSTIFDTITTSFQETTSQQFLYEGYGDVISNNGRLSAFLFSPRRNENVLHFIEYNEKTHVTELRSRARVNSPEVVFGGTKIPVDVYNISCEHHELTLDDLSFVSQVYRTVQLEDLLVPLSFDDSTFRFSKSFSSQSLYRAVWTAKALDRKRDEGIIFEYTDCGAYRWIYMLPMLISVLALLVLLFVSHLSKIRSWSSKSVSDEFSHWHLRAQLLQQEAKPPYPSTIYGAACRFRRLFDEITLAESEGLIENSQLVFRGAQNSVRDAPN